MADAVGIRVLVADDFPGFREGMGAVLATCGFAVVGLASNGREAVDLAIRLRPDVVLMDVTMPVMNGIEATKLIRTKLGRVQVVGLSMHDAASVVRDMTAAGAATYLSKTASVQEICDAIRSAAA